MNKKLILELANLKQENSRQKKNLINNFNSIYIVPTYLIYMPICTGHLYYELLYEMFTKSMCPFKHYWMKNLSQSNRSMHFSSNDISLQIIVFYNEHDREDAIVIEKRLTQIYLLSVEAGNPLLKYFYYFSFKDPRKSIKLSNNL